jgi:tRNA (mo5U34)-methyltransferase
VDTTKKLWRQAEQFRTRLAAIKGGICLLGGVWYPYDSLSSIAPLDEFLAGDTEALREMIGNDPVLDIGCADGDVAFFLESLGVSVRVIDYGPTNYNAMAGVHVLKQAFGSGVEIHTADLDQYIELPDARYGLTLLLGILYHLKNPYSILETLAKKSRYCFLSTRIAAFTPDKRTHIGQLPVAYLLDETELNQDPTNFWIFSEAGLRRILKRSGWTVCHYRTVGNSAASDPVSSKGDARAFCLLRSRVADLLSDASLLAGWHDLEFGSWRWTKRRFAFALEAPVTDEPATLRFRFHLPPPIFAQRSSMTLAASVNGAILPPETYNSPGDHNYVRPVAAEMLRPGVSRDVVRVEFELDSAIAPTSADVRELGLLVDFSGAPPILLY